MACRGRALLNAGRGDLDASYAELERALGLHDRLGEPFERARTLLVLSSVQRRGKKKRAAREETRHSALETFQELGAACGVRKFGFVLEFRPASIPLTSRIPLRAGCA
jgi:hypothetical protein